MLLEEGGWEPAGSSSDGGGDDEGELWRAAETATGDARGFMLLLQIQTGRFPARRGKDAAGA